MDSGSDYLWPTMSTSFRRLRGIYLIYTHVWTHTEGQSVCSGTRASRWFTQRSLGDELGKAYMLRAKLLSIKTFHDNSRQFKTVQDVSRLFKTFQGEVFLFNEKKTFQMWNGKKYIFGGHSIISLENTLWKKFSPWSIFIWNDILLPLCANFMKLTIFHNFLQ